MPRHLRSREMVHEASRGGWTDCQMPLKSRKPARWLLAKGRGGISQSQSETRNPFCGKAAGFCPVSTERRRDQIQRANQKPDL